MITLDRVTVRYGPTIAVSQLTDEIHGGEWVGLIGPNGAGKTTLLRSIARLVPHEGEVRIGDEDCAALSRRRLAKLVAYVPQRPMLPADMTVFDYVLLGRTPHIGYFRFESVGDRRVCAALLERLDLAALAQRHLTTLSGGELQRLVIARALAQEAPVLLLDEPTSELDLGRRVDALELVDELREERGLTVISALHDLTLAGQFAHRLVLLVAGTVASSGRPADVLEEASLGRYFGTSVRVMKTEDGELVVVPVRAR